MDEVYFKIDGRMVYLWLAVGAEGEALDLLVQMTREAVAAGVVPEAPGVCCALHLASLQSPSAGQFSNDQVRIPDRKVQKRRSQLIVCNPRLLEYKGFLEIQIVCLAVLRR